MQGGKNNNPPLLPFNYAYTTMDEKDLRHSLEMEIRRAMRIGLDGFAVDAWVGGAGAKRVFEVMLEVCKDKQLPFYITVCLARPVTRRSPTTSTTTSPLAAGSARSATRCATC